MTAKIERLRPGEGERWRDIRIRALQEAPYAFGTTYADAAQWSDARWQAQVVEFATFVAVIDGHDVGVARGMVQCDRYELISMWVDPVARRHGLGAQLLDSVAAWAKQAGATSLLLEVMRTNTAALALYERAGFVRVDSASPSESAPTEIRLVRSLNAHEVGYRGTP